MNTLNEIITFVREEIGEYKMEINEHTLIEDNLGITGGDAIELIQKFGRRFNVDLSSFDYTKYFYPEPSIFVKMPAKVFPLTIGDLEKAVNNGRLI